MYICKNGFGPLLKLYLYIYIIWLYVRLWQIIEYYLCIGIDNTKLKILRENTKRVEFIDYTLIIIILCIL